MLSFKLRIIEGVSFKGTRITCDLDDFTERIQKKQVGLITPSFYPLDAHDKLPQNRIKDVPGDHLRYLGLLDIDMPEGSPPLDPARVNSLETARATNPAFDAVMTAVERFVAQTPNMRVWFTGGKGVRLCHTSIDASAFVKCANKDAYVEGILEHLSKVHPAFDDTICPFTDRSVLRHGVGLRTDLMPKEGGKFAPKLLELDAATQRLSDVRFDLCEDPALSALIVGHWVAVADTIEQQIGYKMDRFMGAEVVLTSDAERKKTQAKQRRRPTCALSRRRSAGSRRARDTRPWSPSLCASSPSSRTRSWKSTPSSTARLISSTVIMFFDDSAQHSASVCRSQCKSGASEVSNFAS